MARSRSNTLPSELASVALLVDTTSFGFSSRRLASSSSKEIGVRAKEFRKSSKGLDECPVVRQRSAVSLTGPVFVLVWLDCLYSVVQ